MKRKKSIGLRILLGIAAIACGLAVQVVGVFITKLIGIPLTFLDVLFTFAGFGVMGYLIYRWAIK